MDALALLNALDVIRNEKAYQERLNTLAEAKAALETTQYIVETVEVAQARLDEANNLLEKHRKMMSDATAEIAALKDQKLKDVTTKELAVDARLKQVREAEKAIKEQQQYQEVERKKLQELQTSLAVQNESIQRHLEESTEIRNTYIRKLNELKHIVNSN